MQNLQTYSIAWKQCEIILAKPENAVNLMSAVMNQLKWYLQNMFIQRYTTSETERKHA